MIVSRIVAQKKLYELGIDSADDLKSIDDICWALGAYVKYSNLEGAEATLTTNGNKGVITVHSDLNSLVTRQRFSIGHELGHYLLHQGKANSFTCTRGDMNDWFAKKENEKMELDANEFSIEFLLPAFLLKPVIAAQKPSFKLVDEIATTFNMSFFASMKRLVELSDEALAMVIYDNSQVKYHFRSKTFEELKYWVATGPISNETSAYSVINGKNADYMMPVYASSWFNVKSWLEEEMIMEASRFFANYNYGISLLWINNKKLF